MLNYVPELLKQTYYYIPLQRKDHVSVFLLKGINS